jgi:YaiO family outer membrane protein
MQILTTSLRSAIGGLCAVLACATALPVLAQPAEPMLLAEATGLRLPRANVLQVREPGLYPDDADHYDRTNRRNPYSDVRRLGLASTEARSNVEYALGEHWSTRMATAAADPGDPLARHTLHGQLQRSLPGGWDLGFGLRRNDFINAATNALSLSAEGQWGDFRGGYTLMSGLPDGVSAESHRFQLSYRYGERSSFGLAYTSGKDMDYLGAGRGLAATAVDNWSLGGQHRLAPAWALTYDVVHGTQNSLTPRQGLRLGLRHDF